MTDTISKRALILNVPDPAKATKLASEAFMYGRACSCPETFNYNYDQYGRMSHSNALQYGGNGSWSATCTQGTPQHVQERILVENSVFRPYIDFTMSPGFAYDTMGIGRDLIEPRSGGYDNTGAFKSVPMSRQPPPSKYPTPVYPMKTMSGHHDPSCLHYAYANRYTG